MCPTRVFSQATLFFFIYLQCTNYSGLRRHELISPLSSCQTNKNLRRAIKGINSGLGTFAVVEVNPVRNNFSAVPQRVELRPDSSRPKRCPWESNVQFKMSR